MTTIPKNKILQSKGLGDTIGDIVESFNLDLSSNYGAIRTNRAKKVAMTSVELDTPVAFAYFDDKYYCLIDNYIGEGGLQPSIGFDFTYIQDDVIGSRADMKVFNGKLYVSAADTLLESSDGTNFSEAVSSGLTASVHLLEVFKNRLYITDNHNTVLSINTSNSLASVGSAYAINLNLEDDWRITNLKNISNYLWISLINISTGDGLVYSWDGSSLDPVSKYKLPSGVVSSTSLGNILYVLDAQGILKKYAGNDFTEVARLPKKNPNFFFGTQSSNNDRFVHPNGMQTSDRGTILIMLSNKLQDVGYEDSIPSGVWEYDPNVGLYHKYSASTSLVSGTNCNDFGQIRISEAGALFTTKPAQPSLTENGTLLFGASYFTNSSSTTHGIFCDDTNDTTNKTGYFITSFQISDTEEVWQKLYATYKKLKNSISKIIVKYRTEDTESIEATITWTDIDSFTSTTDISDYKIGDEVQAIQGNGSGMCGHIKSITENGGTYTVILDEHFGESNVIPGTTAKVLLSKWIKSGTATYNDMKQIKEFLFHSKNNSPFIQFKIFMLFNGKEELYKLKIISNKDIKQ